MLAASAQYNPGTGTYRHAYRDLSVVFAVLHLLLIECKGCRLLGWHRLHRQVTNQCPRRLGVLCNKPDFNIDELKSNHEEADTRIIHHCCQTECRNIMVWCRDADVSLELLAHQKNSIKKNVVVKAGTSKSPKFIPINEVHDNVFPDPRVALALLAFHSLTGSDTTSFLAGHSKQALLPVFLENWYMIQDLGGDVLSEAVLKSCERFICICYGTPVVTTCDEARVILFKKGRKQDLLPPTSDAVHYHILRSHYQTMIWLKATQGMPQLPSPTEFGWRESNGTLVPVLQSKPPVPEA